ncbi:manganese efflux pump MntP [Pleomorphovibrio marinus]|uniref:manganese efflux pump MntP n=1 Tax=Pleomorphovibrio marinus TaxID=2164132 RepID=UPI0013004E29|nr:manganese efflux pump MntP family protein [Pleomorphovibrio marinus]
MDLPTLILIALGICADSFVVSLTLGLAVPRMSRWKILRISGVMAIFQGGMPVIGWQMGLQAKLWVRGYDHWVALVLLSIIGAKMILDGFRKDSKKPEIRPTNSWLVFALAFATSIDGLIVGVSLAFWPVNIWSMAALIFAFTLVVVYLGLYFGKKMGKVFGKRLEIAAGVGLIIIGLKLFYLGI